MSRENKFPKNAAYFCLAAPFIGSIITSITLPSTAAMGVSQSIDGLILIGILLGGFTLGVYSLFYIRKIKGIVIPATIGLLLHLLVGFIAYGVIKDYRNKTTIFEIYYQQELVGEVFDRLILGRDSAKYNTNETISKLSKEIFDRCPNCSIIRKGILTALPPEYEGIFENKPIEYTYVSIDSKKLSIPDIRYVYPSARSQPTCEDLEAFVDKRKEITKPYGIVNCIEQKND
ncbi:MAG: hypothetical protein PVG39_19260 [Desulfobacteraceae bacterium]|jgi:hypothetical protein